MTTAKIDALIIDDEIHSRGFLRLLLEKHVPDVNIIGEGASANEGRLMLKKMRPQVVFLDIEMPNENGIDLLASLEPFNFYPIMVTSFSEYTMPAIKAHAFDYLLKPVDPQELIATMNSVRVHLASTVELNSAIQSGYSRLELRNLKGNLYLNQDEILFIKASGSYSLIQLENSKHTVSKNLKIIENQLDPATFFRAHNSIIINLKKVVEFINEGSYVRLTDGSDHVVSSSKKTLLLERLRKI